ncbi:MAG TPA: M1 family metallopeptidase [Polyangiaceae bacterium]|nr:M1 family metallopeptidase [Polyangiaceae bacterium]
MPGVTVGAAPESGRLPPDVRPLHYRLDLSFDPWQVNYEGSVEIDLAFERPRNVLWLNGRGLALRRPSLRLPDGTKLEGRVLDVGGDGVFAVGLPAPVGPGRGTLHIRFQGKVGEGCTGVYGYSREGARYLLTQLEATHARDVFPSLDEPAHKTPFDVSITAPAGDVVISNARELRAVAVGSRKKTTFATTPPLPTYLLAFAVGPFDLVEGPPLPPNAVRSRPLRLRGAAWRGSRARLRWALGQAPGLLEDLEQYLGSGYPFDKLDFIATPCDHPTAMENPGAVTVDEDFLLLDEAKATEADRRATSGVIAHELSHMWFGNLVTPRWWSDIWLNESFANWLEAATVGRRRSGDRADVLLVSAARKAMALDSLPAAAPIRRAMETEAEIHSSFNHLTYAKGAAVLGMVERLAGSEEFRRSLRGYLEHYRGGSATAEDLFGALEEGAGDDAVAALRSFLTQPGVPLVEARLDCGGPEPALRLRQSRYLPAGRKAAPASPWVLPFCARYSDAGGVRERCTLLREAEGSLALPAAHCPAWVMPNANGAGYYRWRLPAADLRRLAAALPSLDARERISFVDAVQVGWDTATLAPPDALELLGALVNDPEPEVATALADRLSRARPWLSPNEAAVRNLDDFARRAYAAPLAALGPKPSGPESAERERLRRDLLNFLALTVRDPAARARVAAPARAHLEAKPGARFSDHVALRVAVADGGVAMFDAAFEHFLAASASDRWAYLHALGAAERPALVARARALAFDKRVWRGEVVSLLWALLENPGSRDDTWDWILANLSALRARAHAENLHRLPGLAAGLCEARRADELAARFADPPAADAVAAAAESIRACAAQREASVASLRDFFAQTRR